MTSNCLLFVGLKEFLEEVMAKGPLTKSRAEKSLKGSNLDVDKWWNEFAGARTELSEKDVPKLVDFLKKELDISDWIQSGKILLTYNCGSVCLSVCVSVSIFQTPK